MTHLYSVALDGPPLQQPFQLQLQYQNQSSLQFQWTAMNQLQLRLQYQVQNQLLFNQRQIYIVRSVQNRVSQQSRRHQLPLFTRWTVLIWQLFSRLHPVHQNCLPVDHDKEPPAPVIACLFLIDSTYSTFSSSKAHMYLPQSGPSRMSSSSGKYIKGTTRPGRITSSLL